MNKLQFIEQMRRSLASIDDYVFVNDTIAYYENYIESQVRMGKSEEQVMQELGDPRLIAKSILASHMAENETTEDGAYYKHGDNIADKEVRTVFNINGKLLRMPSWLFKILSVLAVVVIFFLLFTVLRILSPIIMLGFIGYMVYRLVSNITR